MILWPLANFRWTNLMKPNRLCGLGRAVLGLLRYSHILFLGSHGNQQKEL